MTHRALLLAALAGVLAACAEPAPTDPLSSSQHPVVDASVRFANLEGGCWIQEVAEGVNYEPMNLPDQFRRDGLKVQVDVQRRDDVASYRMVGRIVEILAIHAR